MVGAGPGGGDNNKIVATLRSDCKVVYPTNQAASTTLEHQLASLMNYKIVSKSFEMKFIDFNKSDPVM